MNYLMFNYLKMFIDTDIYFKFIESLTLTQRNDRIEVLR